MFQIVCQIEGQNIAPDRKPDIMAEYMSDRMPGGMSEFAPDSISEHMPHRMPGRM